MTHIRWYGSFVLAAGITVGLFYFMQHLIATGEQVSDPVQVVRVVDATMPEIDAEVIEEIIKPEMIEDIPPEEIDPPTRSPNLTPTPSLGVVGPSVDIGGQPNITPAAVGTADGGLVPLITIRPGYPPTAAQRGIEGWNLVSFTVDGLGNVVEDSIVVEDADPPNIFNRSSIRAIQRFKFQPRVINGQGVEVPLVQYLFRYDLDD